MIDELEQEEDAIGIATEGAHFRLAVTVDDMTLEEKLDRSAEGAGRVSIQKCAQGG